MHTALHMPNPVNKTNKKAIFLRNFCFLSVGEDRTNLQSVSDWVLVMEVPSVLEFSQRLTLENM